MGLEGKTRPKYVRSLAFSKAFSLSSTSSMTFPNELTTAYFLVNFGEHEHKRQIAIAKNFLMKYFFFFRKYDVFSGKSQIRPK